MSSPFTSWSNFTFANLVHLAGIFLVALLLNRLLRILTKLLVRPATSQSRAAQSREQQTRTVSGVLYSAGSRVVWAVAILTSLSEFGINVPASRNGAGFDQALHLGATIARAGTRAVYRATGRKVGEENARYARAGNG